MSTRTVRRAIAASAVATFALVGISATAASAGEITGNGRSLKQPDGTLHGTSACAFSGRNDAYSGDPDVPDADGFTRTQNWGQVGREGRIFLTGEGSSPGIACNPSKGTPTEP